MGTVQESNIPPEELAANPLIFSPSWRVSRALLTLSLVIGISIYASNKMTKNLATIYTPFDTAGDRNDVDVINQSPESSIDAARDDPTSINRNDRKPLSLIHSSASNQDINNFTLNDEPSRPPIHNHPQITTLQPSTNAVKTITPSVLAQVEDPPPLADMLFVITNACLVETQRRPKLAKMDLLLHLDSTTTALPLITPSTTYNPDSFRYPYFIHPTHFRHVDIDVKNSTNSTINDFQSSSFVLKGRTLVASYNGQVQNAFHAHNDILLGIWRKQRTSQSDNLLVMGYHEDCEQPWFEAVVQKTFPGKKLVWKDLAQPIGSLVCFEELVLYPRPDEAAHRSSPFYEGFGRFNRHYSRSFFRQYRRFIAENFLQTTTDTSTQVHQQVSSCSADQMIQKPLLTWISRGNDTRLERTIENEDGILKLFERYFCIQKLTFESSENGDNINNIEQFESSLAVLSRTNVLIGLHGAGLTNAIYIANKRASIASAMLIELRHIFGNEKRLFINVANKLDLPYYSFDLSHFSPFTNTSIKLDLEVAASLVEQVWDRWQKQQILYQNDTWAKIAARGECEFTRNLPEGELSPVELSYCYLTDCNFVYLYTDQPDVMHKRNLTREWMQVSTYGRCPMYNLRDSLKEYKADKEDVGGFES